jgi:hypothetical protein
MKSQLSNEHWHCHHVLSPQEMVGEAFLAAFSLLIPLSPLVQNNIDDLIMFTDVLGGRRHKLVHGFTEKRDVAPSVVSYPRYQFSDCFLVLYERSTHIEHYVEISYLMDVFHVNGEHLLLTVCYALLMNQTLSKGKNAARLLHHTYKLLHVFETFPASILPIILVIAERHICKTLVPLLVLAHICG